MGLHCEAVYWLFCFYYNELRSVVPLRTILVSSTPSEYRMVVCERAGFHQKSYRTSPYDLPPPLEKAVLEQARDRSHPPSQRRLQEWQFSLSGTDSRRSKVNTKSSIRIPLLQS